MNKNLVLVAGAIVFREQHDKPEWFLNKHQEGDVWEIPKVTVRKGESSVRAALRMMGEKAFMATRVLEEAGRAGGAANINGKAVSQRHIYYLMLSKSSPKESVGFPGAEWFDYSQAVKKLNSKREKTMLKVANEMYKKWKKERKAKKANPEQKLS
jgi:ADP-ribose pyrophosphatase YjhB (NUDIX family)